MSEVGSTFKSLSQQSQDTANKVADTATDGIRSAQKTTDHVLDKVSSKADEVRSQAAPMLDKVSDQAQKLLQQGREAFNDTTQIVKERAVQASDMAVGYTKDEPMKAMLIAATAGALLMGLVTMMARRD